MGSDIRKTVVEHLSLSALLPVIRFSYGFGLAAILSKQLSVDDYGQWSLFVSTLFLALTIASVNLLYASSVILTGKEYPEQKQDIFSVGIFKIAATMVVFLVIGSYMLLMEFFDLKLIALMGLLLFLINISNMVFGLLRALLRLKRQVLFFAIECGLIITAVSLSTFVFQGGLVGAIYAYILAEVAAASFGLYLMKQYLGWGSFDWSVVKSYLRLALPLLPFAFSQLIVNSLVPLMIRIYDTFEAVAIYSIAQKVALVATIPSAIINNMYAQYLKRSKVDSGMAGVERTCLRFILGYLAMATPLLIGLWFFGRDVILLVSTEAYDSSYRLMLILALVNIMIMLTAMLTTIFAVYERTRVIGYIWIGVLVFYLITNLILVPAYGFDGVMASLVISFGLGLLVVGGASLRFRQQILRDEQA